MKINTFLFFVLVSCSVSLVGMPWTPRNMQSAAVAPASQGPEVVLLSSPRSCDVGKHVCRCLSAGAEGALIRNRQRGEWNVRFCQNLRIDGSPFRLGNSLLLPQEIADNILASQYSTDGCLAAYDRVLYGFYKLRVDATRIICTKNDATKTIIIHEIRSRDDNTYNVSRDSAFAAAHNNNCSLYELSAQ